MSILDGGKLRCIHSGRIEHWCPGCAAVHEIDIHAQSKNGHVIGWDGDTYTPTFAEPIRHMTDKGVCEYVLRGGVLYFMNNCWHRLAGEQRHLEDFPR